MDYRQEARRIASEFGIDPDLFVNLVQAESSFIPDNISEDGAVGLTQIMPNTALKPGYNVTPIENRLDPLDNLRFGAEYYKAMLDEFGSNELALAAYNTGPGNLAKILNREEAMEGETQKYVKNILGVEFDPENKFNIRRRKVATIDPSDVEFDPNAIGASGTDLNTILDSQYGALSGLSAKEQKADPALASLLYFSKMGELASQPGSTLLGSISGAFSAPAEYLANLKKPKTTTGVSGSNVQKVLAAWDNGLVQYLTRDGTMVVKFLNKVYTDPEEVKQLIDEANKFANKVALVAGTQEATLEGLGEGKKSAFKIAAEKSKTASDAIGQLRANIRNYKEGIDAIDEGAQSGFFVQYLPNITQASQKLDNVVKRLGLDVIGSVTFGALSAGELAMAMSTAAPTNMQPEYLKRWFEERIKAKENLLKIQEDMVRFFGAGDKTLKDYYDRVDRLTKEGNWRSTLGLEDVDENYADGVSAPVSEDVDTDSDVDKITAEAEATILRIKTMTKKEISEFPLTNYTVTTPSGKAVRQAWSDRLNELKEQSK
jgi:hypothetical protein